MAEYLRIPGEKLKILLKEKNKLKKFIENRTKTKIAIDEELCEVTVLETQDTKDPLAVWKASDVIKALGRGFEEDIALNMLDDNAELKIISLKDFAGKNKKDLMRLKGRIIGEHGKAKQHIEDATNTHLSVFGKTISIIGSSENVALAAEAVSMLLCGAMHGTVYKMITRNIGKSNGWNQKPKTKNQ